jgi:hypothetical protein
MEPEGLLSCYLVTQILILLMSEWLVDQVNESKIPEVEKFLSKYIPNHLLYLFIKQRTGNRNFEQDNLKRIRKVSTFEIYTAMKIQVEVFWVVTPCSDVGYQRFGGPCSINQGMVSYHIATWRHNP